MFEMCKTNFYFKLRIFFLLEGEINQVVRKKTKTQRGKGIKHKERNLYSVENERNLYAKKMSMSK